MDSIKRIIPLDVEDEFIDLVIHYAREKQMTVTNVDEAIEKVKVFMNDNAVIEKEIGK